MLAILKKTTRHRFPTLLVYNCSPLSPIGVGYSGEDLVVWSHTGPNASLRPQLGYTRERFVTHFKDVLPIALLTAFSAIP